MLELLEAWTLVAGAVTSPEASAISLSMGDVGDSGGRCEADAVLEGRADCGNTSRKKMQGGTLRCKNGAWSVGEDTKVKDVRSGNNVVIFRES